MISLMASLTGFIGSVLPHIINYYRDQADKKHELDIFNLQLKQQELNLGHRLEELATLTDIENFKHVYATYNHNIKFVDALNGLVRPVLAYAFFILYVFIKYLQADLLSEIADIDEYLDILWTIEDQSIFASIISFYFGQRAMRKLYKSR